jgi:flagellar motor switch protein FliN/FliY
VSIDPVSPVPNPDDPGSASEEAAAEAAESLAFDALLDVSMPVIIEIGRTSLTLNEILRLHPGSVVQLDRLVGEAVDIHVSDRKLAEGEIVVVGDHFGVRISRVLSRPPVGAAA